MSGRQFRYDINGLRALAVMAVVLFHFGVPGFSGGFAGVDVFFVISGYLMTGIIFRGLLSESGFSFWQFFMARARRIVPALIVLCAVLLIIGWFYLAPRDYRELGREAARAVLFASNFLYLRQEGYFDSAAHEKMLLHTWSLSVEWQFYMLLPLLLMLVMWLLRSRLALVSSIWVVFVVSFFLSVYISVSAPSSGFYMLSTRAWELLAGGLVYIYSERFPSGINARRAMSWLGTALIAFSIVYFRGTDIWPGWYAAVPVLGASLVIAAQYQKSVVYSNVAAQKVGDWSYSVYLWHWPLVVALGYMQKTGEPSLIVIAILLSVLLGMLSFHWVETPFRKGLTRTNLWVGASLLVSMVVVVFLTANHVRKGQGIPHRLPDELLRVFDEKNINPRFKECHDDFDENIPRCIYGGEELAITVLGDSHAATVMRSVEKALPDNKTQHVLDWSLSGCPIVEGIKNIKTNDYLCGRFVSHSLQQSIETQAGVPLLIVNRMAAYVAGPNEPEEEQERLLPSHYLTEKYSSRTPKYYAEMLNGMVKTACKFAEHRPVYMLRPIPELKVSVPRTMGRKLMYTGVAEPVTIPVDEYLERNKEIIEAQDRAAKECGVRLLEVMQYFCDDKVCRGDQDGIPLYFDDDHINDIGGALLIPEFEKIFSDTTSN